MKAFFYQLLLKILPQQVFITRFPGAIDHIAVAFESGTVYKIRFIKNGIMHFCGVGPWAYRTYENSLASGLLDWRVVPHAIKSCYVDKYDGEKCLGPRSWPEQVKAMYKHDFDCKSSLRAMPTLIIVLRRF